MENIQVKHLKNGIPVLIQDIKSINTVSLGVFVKVGSINEKDYESGVSHYIEHMMFKGTKTRTAKDISEAIDRVGGRINAYTSRDITGYHVAMLASKIDVGIEILSDMFFNSTFTQENLDKEKKVIIEEIKMYDDMPDEVILEENIPHAIKGNASNRIAGTIESVSKIDREIFLNYFNKNYVANNMLISVAGNIDTKKLLEDLDKTFGNMKKVENSEKVEDSFKINTGEKNITKESQQAHVCFNTMGTTNTDDEKYALSIIATVLGGNMSARLFQKIREERGLAYSIYSYPTNFDNGGIFTVYAGTTPENYKEVIEIIRKEFEDIKENGITEEELLKSKNQFLTALTFVLESSGGKMRTMAQNYLTHNKVVSIEDIMKKIDDIQMEDIKKLAQKIFQEKYYSWTILKGE